MAFKETERLAILGPRQSGKSTIAKALMIQFTTEGKTVAIETEWKQAYKNPNKPKKDQVYDIIIYDGCVPELPCRFIYTTTRPSLEPQEVWFRNERK